MYTKCVPLASETVDKLIKMGCRRTVQLPGAVFLTSPGFAFHTTMSSGWSMADSSNFMANILGKVGGWLGGCVADRTREGCWAACRR